MTDLEVRRIRFDFDSDQVPFLWSPENPAFSFRINAISIIAICFEKMIVAAVREAMPLITEPSVAAEAEAFLRQEAQHASAHRQHVRALIKSYPGLQQTFDDAVACFDELTETTTLAFRLAYIASLEVTFAPTFKMMLDNEATLFRPGDDRVASLLLWHFVEEIEHRSSALVIYNAVVGSNWYRLRSLPGVIKHLAKVLPIITEGVNAHVPIEERLVDARILLPNYRMREALRRLSPFGKDKSEPMVPAAMGSVPRKHKRAAIVGVMLSQMPFHDPKDVALPEFADRWFDRFERGDDVSRWYSSERTG